MECAVCGQHQSLKRCSKCHNAYYCSREHQVKHWRVHKLQCKSTTTTTASVGVVVVSAQPESDDVNKDDVDVSIEEREDASMAETKPKIVELELSHTYESPEAISILSESKTTLNQANHSYNMDSPTPSFDSRPLKPEIFPQPISKKPTKLSKFVEKQLQDHGLCVLDNVFHDELATSVLKDVKKLETTGVFVDGKLAGGKTSGDEKQKVVKHSIRSDNIAWLQGDETDSPNICKLVAFMDELIMGLNRIFKPDQPFISGRTKAMVACYPGEGSFYSKHVDNPCGDGRVITCIYYLNPGWDVMRDGGLLRIFHEKDYVDIAPIMNRMILFWSDRRNPHEVQPAFRRRYAITMWYFDHEQREKAKHELLTKEMKTLRGEFQSINIQKKQIQKETLEAIIRTEALTAVLKLTDAELQGLATLVSAVPDPQAALSRIGVHESIQGILLKRMKDKGLL